MMTKRILKIGERYYDYNNGTLLIDNGFIDGEKYNGEDVISSFPMNYKYMNPIQATLIESQMYFHIYGDEIKEWSEDDFDNEIFICYSNNNMSLCRLKNTINLAFCVRDITPDCSPRSQVNSDYLQIVNFNDEKVLILDVNAAVDEMNKIIEEEYEMFKETKGAEHPVDYYKIWGYVIDDDIDE